jgi:molybdate transport repressor ModE-like protein
VWLEIGGRYAFGFGISEILLSVDRTGSIKQAATDLGKSYRYVWGRIKDAEAVLGYRLVETQVGGKYAHRSSLSLEARRLVDAFLKMRNRMKQVVEEEFGYCFPSAASTAGRTRF